MQSFIDVDNNKTGAEVSPHWREYTQNDVNMLIAHVGGCCIAKQCVNYPITNKKYFLHKLYQKFAGIHPALCECIEITCIKNPKS